MEAYGNNVLISWYNPRGIAFMVNNSRVKLYHPQEVRDDSQRGLMYSLFDIVREGNVFNQGKLTAGC